MQEKKQTCADWLAEYLKVGECRLCDDVRDAAKAAGFRKRELKQARAALGVKTFHQFDECGGTVNWFWYLEV